MIMNWLWIPAVVVVGLVVLTLCWQFFKDYTCCPCERKKPPQYSLPTQQDQSLSSVRTDVPSSSRPQNRRIPPPLPSKPPPLNRQYVLSPTGSPNLHFRFGDLPVAKVVRWDRGVPSLDLHHMTVKEATHVTVKFLNQSRGRFRRVKVVTGRGLHTEGGQPKIKPAVAALLTGGGYSFKEISNGGCFEVTIT